VEFEKAGIKVHYDEQETLDYPNKLKELFVQNPEFKTAFENLTKGRQIGYLLFFSAAKQSKTCTTRIEKYKTRIFDGKGMNDCVCGLSKKNPGYDGSHKQLETAG